MEKLRILSVTVLLSLIALMTGCNKEDVNFDAPFVKLNEQTLTAAADGGNVKFNIETNRPWSIEITQSGSESWIAAEPASGEGNAEVTLTLLPNNGVDREATIKVATQTTYEYLKVSQTGTIQTSDIFKMNFGTSAPSSSPYPYVDAYSDWGASGSGANAQTTYTGSGASLRTPSKASSEYAGASGSTSIFFGTAQDGGNAHFEINKIATGGASNFIITFGATRYKMGTDDANTFYPDRMLLYVSNDGSSWSPVNYTFAAGEIWGMATANAAVAPGSEYVYIKFETTEASTMRVDDVILKSTNAVPTTISVFTKSATDVTAASAIVGGSYFAPASMTVSEAGIEYKSGSDSYVAVPAQSITLASFNITLSNLAGATQYTYRAYAKSGSQTYYGAEMNFTTESAVAKTYITVSELRAKGEVTISDDVYVKASLISDQTGGNSTSLKNIVISDGTAGIAVRLKSNAETMAVGTELEFKLKDAVLSKYNGLLQLNNFLNENMSATGETKVLAAKPITAAELITGNYESMYVAVANVQVVNADLTKTMVVGTSHTSINMESSTGESFVMFSSSYSAFKEEQVPQGSGALKGIASVNNAVIQVIPQVKADFESLTGTRFGAPVGLSYGTPVLAGTMTVGTAFTQDNKITLPFLNATSGESYNLSVAVGGAAAEGITTPVTASGTFSAATGDITIALAGTPTTTGAVTFTITGTGITEPIVVNGSVDAALSGDVYLNQQFSSFTGFGAPPTPGVTFNSGASFPGITDFDAAGLIGWTGIKVYKAEGSIKLGASKDPGYIITPALTQIGDTPTNVTLTFKAVSWEATDKNIVISIAEGDGAVANGTVAIPARVDTVSGFVTYTVNITNATKTTKIKIAPAEDTYNRFFLDDIAVAKTK